MKKTVKLLSVLLLISMLFSMAAVSASAIVNDGSSAGGMVIIGGSDANVSNNDGILVIGADQRPEDDSPYLGARVEDSPTYGQEIAQAKQNSAAAVTLTAVQEEAKKYLGIQGADYSDIENSPLRMVQDNIDFLKFVRDNVATIDGPTLQTALDLFGDDLVYGNKETTFDFDKANADLDALNSQIAEYEAQFTAAYEPAPAEAAEASEGEEGQEGAPALKTAAEALAEDAGYQALLLQRETLTAMIAQAHQEFEDDGTEKIDESMDGNKLLAAPSVNPAPPIGGYSSDWSMICGTGGSLASAVGGGTLTFARAFDINNSTDYRITINLEGTTIKAPAGNYAFYIRPGVYGSTISFTNGFIDGNGFYVAKDAVLNLGGLINPSGLDITVNAESTAVRVEAGGLAVVGQGTTLNGWLPAANDKTMPTPSKSQVIYNEGHVIMTGGSVNVRDNGEPATGTTYTEAYGIYSSGTLEISSSIVKVESYNKQAPAIYLDDASVTQIHGGYIYGATGVAVAKSSATLTVNGGAITGFGVKNDDTFPNMGSAIAVEGDGSKDSSYVYVNAGTLRSENTAGLTTCPRPADDAARAAITHIAVDDVNVTIQEKSGQKSDYAKAIYILTVKDPATGTEISFGYGKASDLNTGLAANVTAGKSGNVKMIADDSNPDAAVNLGSAAADTTVTFDGNGHTINVNKGGQDAIDVTGNAVIASIKNVTLEGFDHTADAIKVATGTVTVGPSVTAGHFENGLEVTGGTVTVNGFDVEKHTKNGFLVTGGKCTVVMCKVDADIPINENTTTELHISGGWFLHKEDITKTPPPNATKVATYVDPDTSYVKYVEKDRYYEVLYNDTPTVAVKSGVTGFEADGKTPYVIYDKSDPTPIVFTITPAVVQIDAVSKTGKNYPIFTAEAGKSGDIRIPDSAVLKDCPSGRYDLKITFKNGYVMEDKLHFYVFPKFAGLFSVPNIVELSPTTDANATNNGNIIDYLKKENKTDSYNVTSEKNIAIVMSELPDNVTIGNVPDGSAEMLLGNYVKDFTKIDSAFTLKNPTWGIVPSGPYAGDYFYIVSFADLNNLAVGQNYVFLGWDGIDGALKRLPLNVKNSGVSISPEKIDWSSIDTYANFTVKPSVLQVYIDGNEVEDTYYTYDTATKVLSLKGSYLKVLDKKSHTLEVITPNGKVSATINTGVGLRPKGVDYHVYGGARSLSFIASDKINKDGGVWIGSSNPTKLDPSAYTWDGDTGFTLNAAFLNRLALGTYYISAYVLDGQNYKYTTTTFKVISATQASYNPSTGDNSNIFIWVAVLALSGVALAAIMIPRVRKGRMK